MAQPTLEKLLDRAKVARAQKEAAELDLAGLRARWEGGEAVTIAEIQDAVLASDVAKVRDELATEALKKKADEARRMALDSFHGRAAAELNREEFKGAIARLESASCEVFELMAHHNTKLDELTAELRSFAPFQPYHGAEVRAQGFTINGKRFAPLTAKGDVLPAIRKTHKAALRGVKVPF